MEALDLLLRLWPVVVTLATAAAAVGAGRYALRTITERLDHLGTKLDKTNATLSTMGTTVAVQTAQLNAHTEQDRLRFESLERSLERVALMR